MTQKSLTQQRGKQANYACEYAKTCLSKKTSSCLHPLQDPMRLLEADRIKLRIYMFFLVVVAFVNNAIALYTTIG